MRSITHFITHPEDVLLGLLTRFCFLFPDSLYLKMRYKLEMGKPLDLNNPKTMNEKLQWLKIHNRKPIFTNMVDKILAKEYVANLIGEEYLIPTLKIWDKASDIDISELPNRFVMKTNHSGGNSGVAICRDKSQFDVADVRRKMDKSMHQDIYNHLREWPYKGINKKIFAEAYVGYEDEELVDYKFYCFNGYVDAVMICLDRQIGDAKFYFFDQNWKLKRYNKRGKAAPKDFTLPRPENLDKMFEIASVLSKGIPFLRVDLYNIHGKIYFGETTFFPASGFDPNRLPEMDRYWGDLIDLSMVK